MNMTKKMLVAGAMAAVFSVSGQLVCTDGQNPFVVQRAEAFGLGDVGKSLGKAALSKALNVDVDSLQGKKDGMVLNLSRAAIAYGKAAINVSAALGMDDGQRAKMQAALNNLNNDKTNLGYIKQVGEATKMDENEIKSKADALLNEEDKAKVEQADNLIKEAKVERQYANKYKLLATRDAGMIISSTVKALAKSDSLGDKITAVKNLSEAAKTGKSLADLIGQNHKTMTTALKDYEKKRGIKEVSEEEAEKQMKSKGLE